MAEIIWSEEAERWLKDIHDYIAQDNSAAADKVVSGIYQRAQILLEQRHFS
jgi:plasmid stabilization system protein ParE